MVEHNSEDSEGEQFAKDLEAAIEQTIDAWTEDNSSSAYRTGEIIFIREEELVEKLMIMNAATALSFSED